VPQPPPQRGLDVSPQLLFECTAPIDMHVHDPYLSELLGVPLQMFAKMSFLKSSSHERHPFSRGAVEDLPQLPPERTIFINLHLHESSPIHKHRHQRTTILRSRIRKAYG
jgi:hypothetical protein